MSKYVTCTAAFELDSFHPLAMPVPAPGETRTLSLSFGFASDDPEPGAAQTQFNAFLHAVMGVRVLPYRFTLASDDTVTLDAANGVTVDMDGWSLPTGLPGLMPWLEERSGGKWISDKPTPDREVDYRTVAASHLLHAAAGWNAPLPEMAGLTRLVRLTSTGPLNEASLILVPWFDMNAPRAITAKLVRASTDRIHVDVELGNVDSGGLIDVLIATHSLVLFADPGSLIDEASGYLRVLPRGDQIADALRRLREHAPSLTWTLPQLLALDWNKETVDTKNRPSLEDLGRAVWLGMSGLATLADPLLLALTMGGTTREGPFVAALIAVLEQMNIEQMNSTPGSKPFGAFETTGLAKTVTEIILAHAGPKATADKRARILAKAFDIGVPRPSTLDAETDLLPVVLGIYAKFTPATLKDATFTRDKARSRYGNTYDRQILIELARFTKLAQDEDAVEAAALRVLDHVGIDAAWLRQRLEHPNEPGALAHAEQALAAFGSLLAESFNGLDATRFAQGSLFEAALVTEARILEPNGWDDDDLATRLLESNWFAGRLALSTFPVHGNPEQVTLASIVASLPVIDLGYLGPADRIALHVSATKPEDRTGTLDQSLKAVLAELFPRGAVTRFLPDTSPRNLLVQIAVDTDTTDGDTFQSRFNGVALLVRRDAQTWRYANYASLKLNYEPLGDIAPVIHPLQPVAIDGQRRLFVEYAGVPLASRAFDETFAADATVEEPEDHKPFYEIDDPPLPPEKRLPALEYGSTYGIAAHVVSKAGVLPKPLQRSPEKPWLPSDTPDVPTSGVVIAREVPYRRTTAVGRVMLSEASEWPRSPRIGVAIDGVTPLARDYPRLTLAAPDAATTTLDVLRNADGTGAITLPTSVDERFDLGIVDLWWWGPAGKLTIDVLNKPDALPDDGGAATITFEPSASFAGGSIALRIESDGKNRVFWLGISETPNAAERPQQVLSVPIDSADAGLGGEAPAWLRLRLTGTGATVGFADPTREVQTKHSASRARNESLLVIAPTDGAKWRPELTADVTAVLRFPQVGFIDFDRWFSNAACRALAFPKRQNETEDAAKARAAKFHQAVMTAYLGRMLDPALAALVDAMPDLAVSALRLDLCPVDGLVDMPTRLVQSTLRPKTTLVPITPLGEMKEIETVGIHRQLQRLASTWGASLGITCGGTELTLDAAPVSSPKPGEMRWRVHVNVPRGVVARLNVRAVVPEAFFGEGGTPREVFDERVRQLAVGHAGGVYLFDGPSLTIEGMSEQLLLMPNDELGWIALANKSVVPLPAGKARVYSLVVQHTEHDEADKWNWRKLGSIDVQTQRWRFTGRPIYSWSFDPKAGDVWRNAAKEVRPETPGLDEFETEAFFDRDAQDGDAQTKQLEPGPTETVLQTFPWELPSATMFRHRVTLRSRYAGALLAAATSTQTGYAMTPSGAGQRMREDWIRVVMLADRTRLQLTRPRLRALIPLTASPTSDDSDAASPPVMAVLQEPPFAHGGLAERVSAEIRTGFGFGFEPDPPVRIVDARKEIGPDARLSYAAPPEATARCLTLESEGPIGLTFDTPAAPAPTFANSAWLLRPRLARSENAAPGSLEEHFISVALRRYLDHRWVIDDDPASTGGRIPIASPCWTEFTVEFAVSAGTLDVLDVKQSTEDWTVRLNPVAVDFKGPSPLPMKDLAIAGRSFASKLALLHLPIEEGRASLTVYALPEPGRSGSNRAGGGATATYGDLPLVLASFEWHVPDGVTELTISKAVPIRPTSASPVTQMNWTRTGKSFDVLYYRAGDEIVPIHVGQLGGVVDSSKRSLDVVRRDTREPLHLQTRMERNPLFVHRHLAVISTVKAGGIGRPIEVHYDTKLVIGRPVAIDFGDKTVSALRVVTFETPARPVGLNTLLPEMQSATFDLFAVIGDKYDDDRTQTPKGLTFTYRPLGDTSGRSDLTSLGFAITYADKPAAFTIDLAPAYRNTTPTAVHFSVIGKTISWIVVFRDGSTQAGKTQSALELDLTNVATIANEMIEVRPTTFKNSSGAIINVEYWGDISMLTVPLSGDPSSFEWNWLFTGRDLAASEAVQATRLVNMAEAEARIVAMSPPITMLDPA